MGGEAFGREQPRGEGGIVGERGTRYPIDARVHERQMSGGNCVIDLTLATTKVEQLCARHQPLLSRRQRSYAVAWSVHRAQSTQGVRQGTGRFQTGFKGVGGGP